MHVMKKFFTIVMMCCLSSPMWAQDTLVGWTFPTGTGNDSLPDFAIPFVPTTPIKAIGGTSAISFSTNGLTTFSAQATGWDNGMDTKYWQIGFTSNGYQNLKLSSIVRSGGSNPGPRDFKIQYKIGDNGTWTDVAGGTITTAANWTAGALPNLNLPPEVDNQSTMIYIRWVMASNLDINDADVLPSWISKMDNIFVKGDHIATGLSQSENPNEISIYPNPATGIISVSNFPKGFIDVYNSAGQQVKSADNEETGSNISFDLSDLPRGIYFCRFRTNGEVKTSKILLER